MSTVGATNPLAEQEERDRQALRDEHKVSLVEVQHEGLSINKTATGTYGFTYSPTAEEMPVFCKRTYQGFEVHHLGPDVDHLVGFVTSATKEQLRTASADTTVQLYPEPWNEATQLISLDYRRIAKSKRLPSRDEGNFVKLEVAPA